MLPPKGVPMYLKVAETIRERILHYTYTYGDWIPPARDMAQEFGVSLITIRKAVERLVHEGYLSSRQGSGTRVVFQGPKKLEIKMSGNFRQWFGSTSGKSPRLKVEILEMSSCSPPPTIQALLGLRPGQQAGHIRRVRRHQGQIVSYYINYFDAQFLAGLSKKALLKQSFIEAFQAAAQIVLTKMEQQVEAITADIDLAAILDTDYGAPLFFIKNIYYAGEDNPTVVTYMYYRGDRYVYREAFPLCTPAEERRPGCGQAGERIDRCNSKEKKC